MKHMLQIALLAQPSQQHHITSSKVLYYHNCTTTLHELDCFCWSSCSVLIPFVFLTRHSMCLLLQFSLYNQHYSGLITFAVSFWLFSHLLVQTRSIFFLVQLKLEVLLILLLLGWQLLSPFWFLDALQQLMCKRMYASVFFYSVQTFKLFGWLYDLGWLAEAHLLLETF